MMSHLAGVHINSNKKSGLVYAKEMEHPTFVRIPLGNVSPAVCVGDKVKIGQVIGEDEKKFIPPVHASISGEVKSIDGYVEISGDGKNEYITADKTEIKNREALAKAAYDSGLVGLGGAGFPTHIKLKPMATVDTLIINGAECEPYVISDRCVMSQKAREIAEGADIIAGVLGITRKIIGIEKNSAACAEKLSEYGLEVKILGDKYPKGAEKVIIYECTGRVVKEKKLPSDCGVIVLNAATVAKLAEYVKTGISLVSRYVTFAGPLLSESVCFNLPIGTPVSYVLDKLKVKAEHIIDGGVMMGREVTLDSVITKTTGAILLFDQLNYPTETSCIRCGRCYRICPVMLSPAAIDRAYHKRDVRLLKNLKVNICVECGCCEYVCPAKRRLTEFNRRSKMMLKEAENA